MKTLNQNLPVEASNQINSIYAQVDARIDEPQILIKAWSDYLNELNERLGLNLSTSFRAVIPLLFLQYYQLADIYVETAKYIFAEYIHLFILEPHSKKEHIRLESELITIAANILLVTIPFNQADEPRITEQINPNFDIEKFRQAIL
jgi:hypothetical protein